MSSNSELQQIRKLLGNMKKMVSYLFLMAELKEYQETPASLAKILHCFGPMKLFLEADDEGGAFLDDNREWKGFGAVCQQATVQDQF
jgi:hypothetical protein